MWWNKRVLEGNFTLSEQTTVTLPRVSTAGRVRTTHFLYKYSQSNLSMSCFTAIFQSTYAAAMRRTPSAMVTVVTATRPSGITDTAKLNVGNKSVNVLSISNHNTHAFWDIPYLSPTFTMVRTSFFQAIPITTTSTQSTTAMMTRYFPRRASFLWIGVLTLVLELALIAELILPI